MKKFLTNFMPEGLQIPQQEGHLNKGVKGIFVCVGTEEDFKFEDDLISIKSHFSEKNKMVHGVKYGRGQADLEGKGFLQVEDGKCVLSPVDSFDKFSLNFFSCTGLVVTGTDKETGDNISFLSHQNPHTLYLPAAKDHFISYLNQRFSEIKERCLPGTVDAVIIGGEYSEDKPNDDIIAKNRNALDRKKYFNSTGLLSKEIQQSFNFKPFIINGPKLESYFSDDIYYDNKNRRLYFIRPKVNSDTKDFVFGEVDKGKNKQ